MCCQSSQSFLVDSKGVLTICFTFSVEWFGAGECSGARFGQHQNPASCSFLWPCTQPSTAEGRSIQHHCTWAHWVHLSNQFPLLSFAVRPPAGRWGAIEALKAMSLMAPASLWGGKKRKRREQREMGRELLPPLPPQNSLSSPCAPFNWPAVRWASTWKLNFCRHRIPYCRCRPPRRRSRCRRRICV